jgi:hypothetical protein
MTPLHLYFPGIGLERSEGPLEKGVVDYVGLAIFAFYNPVPFAALQTPVSVAIVCASSHWVASTTSGRRVRKVLIRSPIGKFANVPIAMLFQ